MVLGERNLVVRLTGAELRAVAFEEPFLLVGELDGGLSGVAFGSEQLLVSSLDLVAESDATDAVSTDADVLERQLFRPPAAPCIGTGGRVQDELGNVSKALLNVGGHTVRMWVPGPTFLLDEARVATDLEGAADLVERGTFVALISDAAERPCGRHCLKGDLSGKWSTKSAFNALEGGRPGFGVQHEVPVESSYLSLERKLHYGTIPAVSLTAHVGQIDAP